MEPAQSRSFIYFPTGLDKKQHDPNYTPPVRNTGNVTLGRKLNGGLKNRIRKFFGYKLNKDAHLRCTSKTKFCKLWIKHYPYTLNLVYDDCDDVYTIDTTEMLECLLLVQSRNCVQARRRVRRALRGLMVAQGCGAPVGDKKQEEGKEEVEVGEQTRCWNKGAKKAVAVDAEKKEKTSEDKPKKWSSFLSSKCCFQKDNDEEVLGPRRTTGKEAEGIFDLSFRRVEYGKFADGSRRRFCCGRAQESWPKKKLYSNVKFLVTYTKPELVVKNSKGQILQKYAIGNKIVKTAKEFRKENESPSSSGLFKRLRSWGSRSNLDEKEPSSPRVMSPGESSPKMPALPELKDEEVESTTLPELKDDGKEESPLSPRGKKLVGLLGASKKSKDKDASGKVDASDNLDVSDKDEVDHPKHKTLQEHPKPILEDKLDNKTLPPDHLLEDKLDASPQNDPKPMEGSHSMQNPFDEGEEDSMNGCTSLAPQYDVSSQTDLWEIISCYSRSAAAAQQFSPTSENKSGEREEQRLIHTAKNGDYQRRREDIEDIEKGTDFVVVDSDLVDKCLELHSAASNGVSSSRSSFEDFQRAVLGEQEGELLMFEGQHSAPNGESSPRSPVSPRSAASATDEPGSPVSPKSAASAISSVGGLSNLTMDDKGNLVKERVLNPEVNLAPGFTLELHYTDG